ncbi:MAG: alpha/beta hydrolase [Thermomicrobiales bacterium]
MDSGRVISADGTTIAFDHYGSGPSLIVVGGATATRGAAATLCEKLASHLSAYTYDRRGRGDSGDTLPYAVEREIEDIDAMIAVAGGSAFVLGQSSGAVLALRAAATGLPISRLAVYEPPFIVDDGRSKVPENYVAHLNELVAAGKRGDAFAYFLKEAVGIPDEYIERMKGSPIWESSEQVAHTIAYDGEIMGETMWGKPLSRRPWEAISVPTLVMDGGASAEWQHKGVRELVAILPNARHLTLEGQGHGPADDVLAPVLVDFFLGGA